MAAGVMSAQHVTHVFVVMLTEANLRCQWNGRVAHVLCTAHNTWERLTTVTGSCIYYPVLFIVGVYSRYSRSLFNSILLPAAASYTSRSLHLTASCSPVLVSRQYRFISFV